ncbi:hypothetical protein KC322_g18 [Hortaea werneckii]|nr:hypothetical protein KC322_g18 [Hortaea werneckii]
MVVFRGFPSLGVDMHIPSPVEEPVTRAVYQEGFFSILRLFGPFAASWAVTGASFCLALEIAFSFDA